MTHHTGDVPRIDTSQPHVLTEEQRELVARHLDDLAQQWRAGVWSTVPPSMIERKYVQEPVPGVVIHVHVARPVR